jgi:hypothetical protein
MANDEITELKAKMYDLLAAQQKIAEELQATNKKIIELGSKKVE